MGTSHVRECGDGTSHVRACGDGDKSCEGMW